jgi:hypothetical protein
MRSPVENAWPREGIVGRERPAIQTGQIEEGERNDTTGRRRRVWLLKEHWDAPAEAIDALTDEENLAHAKSVFVAANGDGRFQEGEKRG